VHIATHLDIDIVAVEGSEQVSLLLNLSAPTLSTEEVREPSTLVVVLDRSGSMAGERLEGAKTSLLALVDRLDPTDQFGLITFDDVVQMVVPTAPLHDKAVVKAHISAIQAGGSTDVSGGYLRGLQEAHRAAGPSGATVLLVSDGHANAGITDPTQVGAIATKARKQGITTSALGFGLGYDEQLLGAIARGGAGNELFAETPDEAINAMAGEVEGLLSQSAQAASLLVRMAPACKGVRILNELPATMTPDGLMIELGSFWSGEERKLVLTFDVPGIPALGLAEIARLDLGWVELPALVQHTVSVPVHVNVVPGDQAAGRIPNPIVRSELAFQQTQQAKRRASDLLSQGDVARATSELVRAHTMAVEAWKADPDNRTLQEECNVIGALLQEAQHGDVSRAAKLMSSDVAFKSRTRGRRTG